MNITLTEKAAGRLQEIIKSKGENLALRVMVRAGGCGCSGFEYGMALERNPRSDDTIAEREGIKLVVDPNSAELLDGATIDYIDNLMGGGFAISNPNAVSGGCGCGGNHGDEESEGCGCGGGCGCSH